MNQYLPLPHQVWNLDPTPFIQNVTTAIRPSTDFDRIVSLKRVLRWGSSENPMKSAYLVAQGYANFCKMVSINPSSCRRLWTKSIPSNTVPLCNDPIGLIQKGHLNHISNFCRAPPFPNKYSALPGIGGSSPEPDDDNQLIPYTGGGHSRPNFGDDSDERVRQLETRVSVAEKSNRALLEECVRLQVGMLSLKNLLPKLWWHVMITYDM